MNTATPIHKEKLPPCFVCKKVWLREQTDKYVYHDSVGVVCKHHHGVYEWYHQLLNDMGNTLREQGVIP